MTPIAILIGSMFVILIVEYFLWSLFCRRVEGLHLHLHQASTTGRQIFTLNRIRLCVILHMIFLIVVTGISLLFLW